MPRRFVIGTASEDSEGCHFDDVDTSKAGDTDLQHLCEIVNERDPVEVAITKDWVIEGQGGDALDAGYKLKLVCDGVIVDGHECSGSVLVAGSGDYGYCVQGTWSKSFWNHYGDNDHTYTAGVIPDWDGGTNCWVKETVYDDSVEVENGCGGSEAPGLHVEIAEDDSCTITKTVFYEGIPALSQDGLVVLAILMLGVGLVGFRRFVWSAGKRARLARAVGNRPVAFETINQSSRGVTHRGIFLQVVEHHTRAQAATGEAKPTPSPGTLLRTRLSTGNSGADAHAGRVRGNKDGRKGCRF